MINSRREEYQGIEVDKLILNKSNISIIFST